MHSPFQCIRCILSGDQFFSRIHLSDSGNSMEITKPWKYQNVTEEKKNCMKTIPRFFFFYLWFKNSEQNENVHHIYRCLWIEISYIPNWRSNSSFISWPEIKSPVTKSSVKKWAKDAFHEIDTLHKIHIEEADRERESRKRKKSQMIAVQFDLFLERSFNC